MKKKLYYIIPFVTTPLLMLLCEFLDNMNLVSLNLYALIALCTLYSVGVGFFSPTHRKFDYLLSAIMPLSLLVFMFVVGLLDKSDLETRFHLYKAVNAAFQSTALLTYLFMAISTFLFSFQPLRNIRKWKANG